MRLLYAVFQKWVRPLFIINYGLSEICVGVYIQEMLCFGCSHIYTHGVVHNLPACALTKSSDSGYWYVQLAHTAKCSLQAMVDNQHVQNSEENTSLICLAAQIAMEVSCYFKHGWQEQTLSSFIHCEQQMDLCYQLWWYGQPTGWLNSQLAVCPAGWSAILSSKTLLFDSM